MKEWNALEDCYLPPSDEVVLALGVFDGVHLAHRRIIEECKHRAAKRNGHSVIFTFQNHPSSALRPEKAPPLLTPYPLKRLLLQQSSVDALIGIPFDLHLSHIKAKDFVEKILIEKLSAKEVVVGFNFCFGFMREGTPDLLRQYVPGHFDSVKVVDQQKFEGEAISSTLIRQKILNGELRQAQRLLDRPYQLAGTVVRGDGRGRKIGIPTANIDTSQQVLPPNGVYGVSVRIRDLDAPSYWGVMNIGNVPTFTDQKKRTTEVHLLNHEENLYDQYLIVDIHDKIRDERKFSGPSELVAQIYNDITTFRQYVLAHSK